MLGWGLGWERVAVCENAPSGLQLCLQVCAWPRPLCPEHLPKGGEGVAGACLWEAALLRRLESSVGCAHYRGYDTKRETHSWV